MTDCILSIENVKPQIDNSVWTKTASYNTILWQIPPMTFASYAHILGLSQRALGLNR